MNRLRGALAAIVATLRDGPRLFWLAPLIPAFAILPEFVQHVAEIKLGMFAGPAAFKALANDPTRWAFGYVKIAGLFVTIFAAARYWSVAGGDPRWWDLRTIAWRPFLIGLAINLATSVPLLLLKDAVSATTLTLLNALVSIATIPVLVYMLGGLLGDQTVRLREVYRSGWLRAVLMALLFFASLMLPQVVHRFDHTLAMGASSPAVWALMVWDALLVGLMASWAGTGLATGYRAFNKQAAGDRTSPERAATPARA